MSRYKLVSLNDVMCLPVNVELKKLICSNKILRFGLESPRGKKKSLCNPNANSDSNSFSCSHLKFVFSYEFEKNQLVGIGNNF